MFRKSLPVAMIALVAIAGVTDASAKSSGSRLLPKTSLMYKMSNTSTKEEVLAVCAEIIKRQNTTPIAMMDASYLYMWGGFQGFTCIKSDYYRALVLARDSGDALTLKWALGTVQQKADAGFDKAVTALAKFAKD